MFNYKFTTFDNGCDALSRAGYNVSSGSQEVLPSCFLFPNGFFQIKALSLSVAHERVITELNLRNRQPIYDRLIFNVQELPFDSATSRGALRVEANLDGELAAFCCGNVNPAGVSCFICEDFQTLFR